jgi:hypothetical protein
MNPCAEQNRRKPPEHNHNDFTPDGTISKIRDDCDGASAQRLWDDCGVTWASIDKPLQCANKIAASHPFPQPHGNIESNHAPGTRQHHVPNKCEWKPDSLFHWSRHGAAAPHPAERTPARPRWVRPQTPVRGLLPSRPPGGAGGDRPQRANSNTLNPNTPVNSC